MRERLPAGAKGSWKWQQLRSAAASQLPRGLGADRHPVLWLSMKPAPLHQLRQHAQASGINPRRLIAAPYFQPIERFIAAMACADLFLDTVGFGAGAIGVLALNAGLPLLTLPADSFVSRMGASLCHSTGLDSLVAPDLAAYQERALELCQRPSALQLLRDQLCQAPQDLPLFQQRRWVHDLVHLLESRLPEMRPTP